MRIDINGFTMKGVTYEECSSWDEAAASSHPTFYHETFDQWPPLNLEPRRAEPRIPAVYLTAVFALCAAVAGLRKDKVRVLSIGDGFAAHFLETVRLLHRQAFDWTVLDLPAIVDHARRTANPPRVAFTTDWSDVQRQTYDVVHFAGVLQYLEDWRGRLREAIRCEPTYLLLPTNVHLSDSTFIYRQNVVFDKGTFSIPGRAIGVSDLMALLAPDFTVLSNWQPEKTQTPPGRSMYLGGPILESRPRVPETLDFA